MFSREKRPVSPFPFPPKRFRMGGEHFKDDAAFLATAVADVVRLESLAGLTRDSRVLDWGCGAGRLGIGIGARLGRVADYHGVDVQPDLIEWAESNIDAPGFRFTCVNVSNERYNPDGRPQRTLATDPDSVDVVYAYSVLSHMNDIDSAAYLALIREALSPAGAAFLTCFVEEDVPAWEENPAGYGPLEWKGRLHCTRFSRRYFEDQVADAGLRVVRFEYGGETDGQSLYILRRR